MTEPTNAVAVAPSWVPAVDNRDDLDLIKKTYAKDLHDNELQLFVAHANQLGLSIIKKQIYAIVRGKGEYRQMGIQVGIDGYRAITESNPDFAGYTAPQWCGDDGEWKELWVSDKPPAAARIGIYRRGFAEPIWGVATYREYVQTVYDPHTKTHKPNAMWQKMPANQLLKCAESQAHRRATPGVLGGTEMFDGDSGDVETVEAVGGGATVTISGADPQEEWKRASARLHAIAADNQIDHDTLRLFARSKKLVSLKDVPAHQLNGLANSMEQNPLMIASYFESLAKKVADMEASAEPAADDAEPEDAITDAEFRDVEVDPATGEVIPPHVGRSPRQQPIIDLPTDYPNHGNA